MKVLPVKSINYRQISDIKVKNDNANNITNYSNQNVKSDLPLNSCALLIYFGGTKRAKLEDFQIKDLTDEEFEAKKAEILAKKDKFKPFRCLQNDYFTKWNVQLLDYMYQDCKCLMSDYPTYKDMEKENNLALYNKYIHLQRDPRRCVPVETKEQAQVILKMMKMPWFFASDEDGDWAYALKNAGYNIKGKKSAEIKDVKLKMLDELEKNREKYEECTYDQKANICGLLTSVTSDKGLDIALKMISNPSLLDIDNTDLSQRAFFNRLSRDDKQAQIVSDIIDKVIQTPELFEKEYFADALSTMLAFTNNKYQKELVLTFLDNPALFEYEDFELDLPGIISDFPSTNSAEDENTRKFIFEQLKRYKENPGHLDNYRDYGEPYFVSVLTDYCELPDLSCPAWPIPDDVIDFVRENPEILDDEWI